MGSSVQPGVWEPEITCTVRQHPPAVPGTCQFTSLSLMMKQRGDSSLRIRDGKPVLVTPMSFLSYYYTHMAFIHISVVTNDTEYVSRYS